MTDNDPQTRTIHADDGTTGNADSDSDAPTAITQVPSTNTTNDSAANAANAGGTANSGYRAFRRSRENYMIAGICGGAGQLLGVDPALFRVLLVLVTVLGFGIGIVIYLACWVIVPQK